MAKAQRSNPNKDHPAFLGPRNKPRWIVAVICLILAVFLCVAMFDYVPEQFSGNRSGAASVVENGAMAVKSLKVVDENLVGSFGVYTTYYSYSIVGGAAWLIPAYLFWLSYLALRSSRRFAGTRIIVMVFSILSCAGLWEMQSWFLVNRQWFPHGPGGFLGNLIYHNFLRDIFGVFGSGTLLALFYAISILFILTKDIGNEVDKLAIVFQEWKARRAARRAQREEERRLEREKKARERIAASMAKPKEGVFPNKPPLTLKKTEAEPTPNERAALKEKNPARPERTAAVVQESAAVMKDEGNLVNPAAHSTAPEPENEALEQPPAQPVPVKANAVRNRETPKVSPSQQAAQTATDTKDLAVGALGAIELNIVQAEETKKARAPLPHKTDANYQFPPVTLLSEQAIVAPENSFEEHRRNAENLLRILKEFGVEVSLGEIHVGPVITRYEVVPAPGVRVEKIAALDKNIALGMRAQSVRIQAPIPGKAAVGVEVPNLHPTPVGVREIIESEDWVGSKAEIPIALGKDVSGKPLISDLTKMPHLLIAGATGSGKSVCINSIIASILYSKSPKDLRLIMVDPKVVELKIFNTLPHMLIPVVTEPKKVPAALKWLLREMETRYQIFAKCNVRNIIGFNTRKRPGKSDDMDPFSAEAQSSLEGMDLGDDLIIPDRLPYIVAIIDELADLMMVAPAEIETSVARLAQLARAAGIHLIIATQRPSVNVITGVIKANLPSRIAFQVASQVDSRTIIDGKGADTLIGRGDMLFTPPGTSRLVRAQGAFVADDEISEVVEFLKRNGPPAYAQDVQAQIDEAAKEDDDEAQGVDTNDMDDETLFKKAIGVLRTSRRASTSMLQRRLKIGYNRAARIMELMEERGIVGPENGSSPREILADLDSL